MLVALAIVIGGFAGAVSGAICAYETYGDSTVASATMRSRGRWMIGTFTVFGMVFGAVILGPGA